MDQQALVNSHENAGPMMSNDLTIILTLKGRFNYTRRWMSWAISRKCPFRILVADGGLDDAVRHYLSELEPNNLNLEYVRYPPDLTLKDWFAKISDITQRVKTKYAILADNDDFLFFDRLALATGKMECDGATRLYTAPYYCMNFDVTGAKKLDMDALVKPTNGIFFKKSEIANFGRYNDKNIINRLEHVLNQLPSAFFWYGIHLSSELHTTHSNILKGDVNLAMIQEWYLSYRAVIKDSIIYGAHDLPYLVRQEQTSEAGSALAKTEAPHRIFLNRSWSDDLDFMIRTLYHDAVDEGLTMPFAEFEVFFKKHFEKYFLTGSRFAYLSLVNNRYVKVAKYVYRLIDYWRRRTSVARYASDTELVDLKHFLVNYRT